MQDQLQPLWPSDLAATLPWCACSSVTLRHDRGRTGWQAFIHPTMIVVHQRQGERGKGKRSNSIEFRGSHFAGPVATAVVSGLSGNITLVRMLIRNITLMHAFILVLTLPVNCVCYTHFHRQKGLQTSWQFLMYRPEAVRRYGSVLHLKNH